MKRVDFIPYVAELRASAPHPPRIPHVTSGVSFHSLHAALNQFAQTYHYVFVAGKTRRKNDMDTVVMKCFRPGCKYRVSVFSETISEGDETTSPLSWLEYDSDDMPDHNHELDGSDLTEEDRKRMKRLEKKRRRGLREIQRSISPTKQDSFSSNTKNNHIDKQTTPLHPPGSRELKDTNGSQVGAGLGESGREIRTVAQSSPTTEPLFLYSDNEVQGSSPGPSEQPPGRLGHRSRDADFVSAETLAETSQESLFLHSSEDDDIQEISARQKTPKPKKKKKKKKLQSS